MQEQTLVDNTILRYFFKHINDCKIIPFGSGLIHRTFFLQHPEGDFILQKINHLIFQNPKLVMENIQAVGDFLLEKKYPKTILEIRPTLNGSLLLCSDDGGFWRIFNFISDTQYFSKPTSVQQVYETGKSFGEFLFYLKDFPQEKIHPSIPGFHDVKKRFLQLEKAIKKDAFNRVKMAKPEIEKIWSWRFLIEEIDSLVFPKRVVHADPKINNLLFDNNGNVKAVVDWDTIMIGNLIFDFGDLVRTMCCTEDEESKEFSKVKISIPYFEMLRKGFLESTQSFLFDIEKDHLLLGAKIIIYEQAIRFLADFLDGDKYYNTVYTGQNFNRAKNQMVLLEDVLDNRNLQFLS